MDKADKYEGLLRKDKKTIRILERTHNNYWLMICIIMIIFIITISYLVIDHFVCAQGGVIHNLMLIEAGFILGVCIMGFIITYIYKRIYVVFIKISNQEKLEGQIGEEGK